ncbi:MAG: type I-F CRISPR-associated endoribonuclease Cas6/Csy4 [Ghiorsea sp.]|nr:type I-F CRISPR-associated endoribonuclease Cas6/Csy4 [Ghiorsea sp.]
MDCFLDVKIKPDEEMRENLLFNKVYTKLHKALSTMNATDIGVSFPRYKAKLGDVLRIHADKQRLDELQAMNWLGGLSGYCEVSDVLPIPESIEGYRIISRKQPTMTLKKLESRVEYQKEKGVLKTNEDVKAYERQYKEKMYDSQSLDNPYLELTSRSNGHKHRRFIQFGRLLERPTEGEFDQFGLSKNATIPWF